MPKEVVAHFPDEDFRASRVHRAEDVSADSRQKTDSKYRRCNHDRVSPKSVHASDGGDQTARAIRQVDGLCADD